MEIATRLKNSLHLPQDMALTMANDNEDAVACPILEHSYLLGEDVLIQLTQQTDKLERLKAIASRNVVSKPLSRALMLKELPELHQQLFRNKAAALDEEVLWHSLQAMPPNAGLMALLSEKPELSAQLRDKLAEYAAMHRLLQFTGQELPSGYRPESEIVTERQLALLRLRRDQLTDDRLPHVIESLAGQGRITISLLLRALCVGEFALVEQALAQLASVPLTNMRILLRDKGGRGCVAVYRAAGLPDSYQSVFLALLRIYLNDASLATLHPRLLRHHLIIAIQDEPAEAVEYTSAIIRQATEDMEHIAQEESAPLISPEMLEEMEHSS